jgi:hypothetical protein
LTTPLASEATTGADVAAATDVTAALVPWVVWVPPGELVATVPFESELQEAAIKGITSTTAIRPILAVRVRRG